MTRIKICGITNIDDAELAASAGADYLGFVFYPPSPRNVAASAARDIITRVKPRYPSLRTVGVFVDEPPDEIWEVARGCGLDLVQLHGSEPPDAVAALMGRGLGVIKAFRVRDAASLARVRDYRPGLCLLDTYVQGLAGGTGRAFDWSLAAEIVLPAPVLLAGGLTHENVMQAVRAARPWGVDVSSGVECSAGHKDPVKLRQFIAAARMAVEDDNG